MPSSTKLKLFAVNANTDNLVGEFKYWLEKEGPHEITNICLSNQLLLVCFKPGTDTGKGHNIYKHGIKLIPLFKERIPRAENNYDKAKEELSAQKARTPILIAANDRFLIIVYSY